MKNIVDIVVTIIESICTNTMDHWQFMELLKKIDSELNDLVFFAILIDYVVGKFYKDLLYC